MRTLPAAWSHDTRSRLAAAALVAVVTGPLSACGGEADSLSVSVAQALGYPRTYPVYGDRKTAWASSTPDGWLSAPRR